MLARLDPAATKSGQSRLGFYNTQLKWSSVISLPLKVIDKIILGLISGLIIVVTPANLKCSCLHTFFQIVLTKMKALFEICTFNPSMVLNGQWFYILYVTYF